MLTELRGDVKTALANAGGMPAGFKALEYIGESITTPCAVVVPGQPYIEYPNGDGTLTFGGRRVNVDVLLLTSREAAKTAANLADQLIEAAMSALDGEFDVKAVSRPGVVRHSGSKFIGSVLTIAMEEL